MQRMDLPLESGPLDVEATLREWVNRFDQAALARAYHDAGGLLVLPRLLPDPLLRPMIAEGEQLATRAVRKHALFVRKGGAVSHRHVVAHAPTLHAVHQSPSLLALFQRVSGVPLSHRNPGEAHASALYTYTRRGDFMDWHEDECGCPPGDSFSTILGLVDESESVLELETPQQGGPPLRTSLRTVPGTFAFFCGARARHRVTPLGAGQRRVTFAFTYIREGRRPGGVYDLRMKLGHALVYFGGQHLFGR
jgi:hypothetical protein